MAIDGQDDSLGVDLYLIEHRLRDLALEVERVPTHDDFPLPTHLALDMTNVANSIFHFTSGRTISRPRPGVDTSSRSDGWVLVE